MELRNLVLVHIFFLVLFNMAFSFTIMAFSLLFFSKTEDIFDGTPKTPRLANQIAFYINFLNFYFLLIIKYNI